MKQLARVAVVITTLAVSGPARAWTLVYEGFPYEPTSVAQYTFDSGAYQIGREPYEGDYLYDVAVKDPADRWGTTIVPPVITQGYFPFITSDSFAVTGMPLPTGHCVQLFCASSTNGKGSRLGPGGARGRFGSGPGTLYYSLMLKGISSSGGAAYPNNGGFFAGFNNSPPGTDGLSLACTKLLLRKTAIANQFEIGLCDGSDANRVWHATTYTAGATSAPIFVVGAYEFKNNWGGSPNETDDVQSLWIDPDSSTFGTNSPPAATLSVVGTDMGGFPSLTIQSFFLRMPYITALSNLKVDIDEIRIGTSWADVTSTVACVPPTITDADPTTGETGTTVTGVTITGTNFVRGATEVRLSMTGQNHIWATNVDVKSDSTLTCDFVIPATAAAGLRNIVLVTCPDSPQTLASKKFAISCTGTAAPTVESIVPTIGYAGTTLTNVAVTGTNFLAGSTTVTLTMAGQPDINATAVNVTSKEALTCTLGLPPSAVSGLRSVVVASGCSITPGMLNNGFSLKRCGDPRFDDDNDGDVDMLDFALFQRCITGGTGGPYSPECRCMNSNGDTVIDTPDLMAFMECASGPSVPANPACDDALPPP